MNDNIKTEEAELVRGRWVERQSARGHTYRVWRRVQVPKIPQHYFECVFYLYDSKESAEMGENFGGSGFLVSVEPPPVFDPDSNTSPRKVKMYLPSHLYAVTNWHVIEDGFTVIRLNTIDGQSDTIELERDDWTQHPDGDDLAVAAIELPSPKHTFSSIPARRLVPEWQITSEIGAGDDVFMVGRFINHAGTQRNTPSLRFGSIAMLPFEKIQLSNGHMQEAFLVEIRSISGYSGSPVFVYKSNMQVIPTQEYGGPEYKMVGGPMGSIALLGIDCAHALDYYDVLDAGGKPHKLGWKVEANTGMAIVIPAWRLEDLLNKPEFIMERQRKDREHRERKEAEQKQSTVAFDVRKKPEGFTGEDYQEALKRASRKISPPDEETKET